MYFFLYCGITLREKVTDVSSSYGYDHQVAVRHTSTSISTTPSAFAKNKFPLWIPIFNEIIF
jgi:hypothetical protein